MQFINFESIVFMNTVVLNDNPQKVFAIEINGEVPDRLAFFPQLYILERSADSQRVLEKAGFEFEARLKRLYTETINMM